MNTLRWLWNASRGHRLPLLGSVAVGTLYVGVSLFFVYVCKLLIDRVTSQPADDLRLLVGLFVGCMVMQLLLSVVRSRLVGHTEIRMRNALRQRLFNHLMESRDSGSGALHTGDMLNRIEEDVTTVTDFLCRSMPASLVTSVQLAGALFFLLSLDVRLAGVLLFVMPVALLFSKTYMHRMRRLSREIRDTDSRVQSHLQEHLQHRVRWNTRPAPRHCWSTCSGCCKRRWGNASTSPPSRGAWCSWDLPRAMPSPSCGASSDCSTER